MAAPTYATDLTTMVDFDGTPSSPTVAEPTGGWTAGRNPTASDTDFPIQSSTHCSLVMNTTGKAGAICDNVSSFTWSSGDYLFGWIIWLAPGAIATQSSGGLAMICGSAANALKVFYVGGSDWGSYPYGGWQNFAVDPTLTQDESIGTPGTDYDFVGAGANVLSAVSKGNPLGFDVFRYGRGEFRVALGDGTTPATFAGMAAANDATTARWGLFQEASGNYKFKGLMILGYASAVTFDDSNKSVVIDDMIYVNSTFNAIEIRNASSDVTWENIGITSLNTTSPGTFEVVDNATVLLQSCVFTDMDTFAFLTNTDALGCTFRRCGIITAAGADMTGSLVTGYEGTANTSPVVWNVATNPVGLLDEMTFEMGTALTHAIEFGTASPTAITLNGLTFNGYNETTNNQNNSTLHVKRTSGTVTISITGSGTAVSNITYRSDGATVVLVQNVVVTFDKMRDNTEVRVYDSGTGAELDGIENATAGTTDNRNFPATVQAGTTVDYVIHSVTYETIRVNDFTWPSTAQTLNVQQRFDRNNENP